MSRLTFSHIIEANKLLEKYELKLSLKDACGASCMQLKNIDGSPLAKKIDDFIYELINNYFKDLKLEISYSSNKEFLFAKDM